MVPGTAPNRHQSKKTATTTTCAANCVSLFLFLQQSMDLVPYSDQKRCFRYSPRMSQYWSVLKTTGVWFVIMHRFHMWIVCDHLNVSFKCVTELFHTPHSALWAFNGHTVNKHSSKGKIVNPLSSSPSWIYLYSPPWSSCSLYMGSGLFSVAKKNQTQIIRIK